MLDWKLAFVWIRSWPDAQQVVTSSILRTRQYQDQLKDKSTPVLVPSQDKT